VVDLGDDVPGALVVDLLDPLVPLHQETSGACGDLEREGELVGEVRLAARSVGSGHGASHATARTRGVVPNWRMVAENARD
jgi:hypothetical protein